MSSSSKSPERHLIVLPPIPFPEINTISSEALNDFWNSNEQIIRELQAAQWKKQIDHEVEKAYRRLQKEALKKIPNSILQEELWREAIAKLGIRQRSLLSKKLKHKAERNGYRLLIRIKAKKKAIIMIPDKPLSTYKASSHPG